MPRRAADAPSSRPPSRAARRLGAGRSRRPPPRRRAAACSGPASPSSRSPRRRRSRRSRSAPCERLDQAKQRGLGAGPRVGVARRAGRLRAARPADLQRRRPGLRRRLRQRPRRAAASVGAGVGARLLFLTLLLRGRVGVFSIGQLYRIGPEVGFHVPLGRVEPRVALGAGLRRRWATSTTPWAAPPRPRLALRGFYTRAGAGVDYYLVPRLLGRRRRLRRAARARPPGPHHGPGAASIQSDPGVDAGPAGSAAPPDLDRLRAGAARSPCTARPRAALLSGRAPCSPSRSSPSPCRSRSTRWSLRRRARAAGPPRAARPRCSWSSPRGAGRAGVRARRGSSSGGSRAGPGSTSTRASSDVGRRWSTPSSWRRRWSRGSRSGRSCPAWRSPRFASPGDGVLYASAVGARLHLRRTTPSSSARAA